ncbi:MAG: hypothetical protein M1817_003887 [Caeruleum heppii]|nr:MAG: hypothetical protein M1817_003887 [Caeruleum heppii]
MTESLLGSDRASDVRAFAAQKESMMEIIPQQTESFEKEHSWMQKKPKSTKSGKVLKTKSQVILPSGSLRKATRPLNSWIAYRSFYSTIFSSLQQKDISGFLTFLWQSDPFKAKWTILAKAYSVIRDIRGKHIAPLDIFLAISAPFVGIIPPPTYLDLLGWEISVGLCGQRALTRRFTPHMEDFDECTRSTQHSVHDVIQHSYEEGFIPADGAEFRVNGLVPATHNMLATQPACGTGSITAAQANPERDTTNSVAPTGQNLMTECEGQHAPDQDVDARSPADHVVPTSLTTTDAQMMSQADMMEQITMPTITSSEALLHADVNEGPGFQPEQTDAFEAGSAEDLDQQANELVPGLMSDEEHLALLSELAADFPGLIPDVEMNGADDNLLQTLSGAGTGDPQLVFSNNLNETDEANKLWEVNFNPFEGDEFDAFNMSQYLDLDPSIE